jgi:hypothetical protein
MWCFRKYGVHASACSRRASLAGFPPEGGTPNGWQIPDYLKIAVLNSPHFKFSGVLSSNFSWRKREREFRVCLPLRNSNLNHRRNRLASLAVCQVHSALELRTFDKIP